MRRRWFIALSSIAAISVIAIGLLLWRAISLSSIATISDHVETAKPLLSALRIAMIGLLAFVWPWLRTLRANRDDSALSETARWRVLRWRVVGWLLVIELVLGQNLLGRLLAIGIGRAA